MVPNLMLADFSGRLAYKEYKSGHRPPASLRSLVALRNKLDVSTRRRLDEVTAWPLRVVADDNGGIRGILIPLIPESYFVETMLPSGKPSRFPRDAQFLFIDPSLATRLGLPWISASRRLTICRDTADALDFLDSHLDVVFGDINAKNILFRIDAGPTVMFIDCDAVRMRGSAAVVRQLHAPDWDAPEGPILSKSSDRYKLALFILRTLTPGPGSSVNRNPAAIKDLFDRRGRELLDRGLNGVPSERPTAREWAQYLSAMARTYTGNARNATSDPGSGRVAAERQVGGWRRNSDSGQWELEHEDGINLTAPGQGGDERDGK
jgi:hypothetical protein